MLPLPFVDKTTYWSPTELQFAFKYEFGFEPLTNKLGTDPIDCADVTYESSNTLLKVLRKPALGPDVMAVILAPVESLIFTLDTDIEPAAILTSRACFADTVVDVIAVPAPSRKLLKKDVFPILPLIGTVFVT